MSMLLGWSWLRMRWACEFESLWMRSMVSLLGPWWCSHCDSHWSGGRGRCGLCRRRGERHPYARRGQP